MRFFLHHETPKWVSFNKVGSCFIFFILFLFYSINFFSCSFRQAADAYYCLERFMYNPITIHGVTLQAHLQGYEPLRENPPGDSYREWGRVAQRAFAVLRTLPIEEASSRVNYEEMMSHTVRRTTAPKRPTDSKFSGGPRKRLKRDFAGQIPPPGGGIYLRRRSARVVVARK